MIKQLVRRLYYAMPFKQQIFTALKRLDPAILPPSAFRRPISRCWVPGTQGFLMQHYNRHGSETEFFWKPISEAWETASLADGSSFCKPRRSFSTLAPQRGCTLVSKCVRPGARVLAFEPLPSAVDVLRRNVALNGYDIPCMPVALSDFEGTAHFYAETPFSNEGSLLAGASGAAAWKSLCVPCAQWRRSTPSPALTSPRSTSRVQRVPCLSGWVSCSRGSDLRCLSRC